MNAGEAVRGDGRDGRTCVPSWLGLPKVFNRSFTVNLSKAVTTSAAVA